MYKTHSIFVALAMLSAGCIHNAVVVHGSGDLQEHRQHGGHPHRRANPANAAANSSSSESSAETQLQTEPLVVDLSWILKDLAAKLNITSPRSNGSQNTTRNSLAGRKRAAHPGCCG